MRHAWTVLRSALELGVLVGLLYQATRMQTLIVNWLSVWWWMMVFQFAFIGLVQWQALNRKIPTAHARAWLSLVTGQNVFWALYLVAALEGSFAKGHVSKEMALFAFHEGVPVEGMHERMRSEERCYAMVAATSALLYGARYRMVRLPASTGC